MRTDFVNTNAFWEGPRYLLLTQVIFVERKYQVRDELRRRRTNGDRRDFGHLVDDSSFPHDGMYRMIKGKIFFGRVYGRRRDSRITDYEVEYTAGPKDKEWFCQIDCNYLKRLVLEGNLQKKELAVWALSEVGRARGERVDDISAWWRTKVFLPNIGELLETAEKEYAYEFDRVLTTSLIQHLSSKTKGFERGLVDMIKGYMGRLDIVPKSDARQVYPPKMECKKVRKRKFSLEYYEKKDRGLADAKAAARGKDHTSVTKHSKPSCVMM